MDAEVGVGRKRWGSGGHAGDYTAGRGAEEVQLLISRFGGRSVYGLMMF
jgi:hypothetical protein